MDRERAEGLFGYLEARAISCPKCRKKLSVDSVKMGFDDEIIVAYACRNEGCRFSESGLRTYRRLLPAALREIKEAGILSEEEIRFIERQRSAAIAAEIRCMKCGYKRRYVETFFLPDGKLLHEYRCDNKDCGDFGKSILTELSDWDCERILSRSKSRNSCSVCGKTLGAKVLCEKEGGFICASHCQSCDYFENRTSLSHCVWFARTGAAEAAKKGLEAYEKALRLHREI